MAPPPYKYTDIIVEVKGQIGIIKLNRPKSLNAFGGNLYMDLIAAIREMNEHPGTIFTVLTGAGRFFSAGADVKAWGNPDKHPTELPAAVKKVDRLQGFAPAIEMLRGIIEHRKVFVLALNGPGVGGGAAWFQGVADIVVAAKGAWLQVPFNALGLVPENGSMTTFAQNIGVHRANEFLMFGRKMTVEELEGWGLVNRIFPVENFHDDVVSYLEEQLKISDGQSMMESKRLQNARLRDARILAVYDSVDALAERFVVDAPKKRFEAKKAELEAKSRNKSKL